MSISPEDALGMVEKAIDRLAPSVGAPIRQAMDGLTFCDRGDLGDELARLMTDAIEAEIECGDDY